MIHCNERLTRLEVFLASFNSLGFLRLFSNVITLQILGQDITNLDDLSHCKHLQHLWVVEGCLESMHGVQHMTGLTHLYLYANRITQIAHLEPVSYTHLTLPTILLV